MIPIIIPTLNEERALPLTLAHLAAQSTAHEIIICDGGSSDGTAGIARKAQVQWLNATRGRGAQMNAGARHALKDWPLFLHDGTLLPATALNAIMELPPHVAAGCFHQTFNHAHSLLRWVSWPHNWRCKHTRIMYDDQAMFLRCSVFEMMGGFPETDLEDVKLAEQLRNRTTPILLPLTVTTDARKFLSHGILRSSRPHRFDSAVPPLSSAAHGAAIF